jgi:dolichyl-phosphate-mannose-protein mannosyltransferase
VAVQIFAGVLPFVALALLIHTFHRRGADWRSSMMTAAVAWGAAVTAITEGLSLLRLLSFPWVLAAWLALLAVLAIAHRRMPSAISAGPAWLWPDRWSSIVAAGLIPIVAATGLIAVLAPPNTQDSLIYHMARVAHWVQNASVAHYPTHIPRQLHLAPWAEFAILQLQILTGGDRLANLIQWLAMVGCVVGVTKIAEQLRAGARGQILAAPFCATIPMGIVQATSTQNDYVLAFWLVCFVYFSRALTTPGTWVAGAALGLAVLTKGTAYVIALPFVVVMAVHVFRQRRGRAALTFAVIAAAVLALNAGHYWRNARLYGTPLGPGREGSSVYANEAMGPSIALSNAVRNLALHVGTPNDWVNSGLGRGVEWLHQRIGIDLNDPRTTWPSTRFEIARPRRNEDYAGNPWHLLVIAASAAMLAIVPSLRRRRDLPIYLATIVAACLLFALVLKWQPWHSRLHLPLFVVSAPLVGVVWDRYRRVAPVLALGLLAASIPWLVDNESRPLIGRESVLVTSRVDQYFKNRNDLRVSYPEAVQRVRDARCSHVGLWIGENPEYPLWILLTQEPGAARPRLDHLDVHNESRRLPSPLRDSSDPCAIVVTFELSGDPRMVTYRGSEYGLNFRAPPVSLFLR